MARPRSTEARRRVIESTVAAMLDQGVERVTIESVAGSSGVAKSTIYRHFGDRERLVAEAIRSRMVEYPTPDTGSLADDLDELAARYEKIDQSELDALYPLLLESAQRDPGLREIKEQVVLERQRPMRTVLRLAQARGEIDPDLDMEVAMALLIGPITYRKLVQGCAVDREFLDTALQAAVAALHSTTTRATTARATPATAAGAGPE